MINDRIVIEENIYNDKLNSIQAGYTIDNFTAKIEQTIQTLILSERYEAVGPLCRMCIPIYEMQHNYKVKNRI